MPNIVTKPFLDAFGWMGGGGMLICLVVAIYIGSKREDYRSITKVGTVPSLFNVSEPMMFGLPVVFNPAAWHSVGYCSSGYDNDRLLRD